ncbi:MAG TPA: RDD family protein [Steroidobacteraceae bacterium]
MAEEELIVRGLTGVDMSLRIAGPGTRSFAFLIDWQIRLLAALALILLAAMLRLLPVDFKPVTRLVSIVIVVLAVLIYLLYHPVLEVLMRGRTPGKRKAGARIVTVEGATPTVGSLLLRNLFRLIDSLPGFYVVGLGCCLFTQKRVRLGDLVAGTVLVLEAADTAKALARLGEAMQRSSLPLEALRLTQDLLDRWQDLEDQQRTRLARDLLAKLDPGFDPGRDFARGGDVLRSRLEALLGAGSGS